MLGRDFGGLYVLVVHHEVVTVGLEAASFYFVAAEPETAAPNGMNECFDWQLILPSHERWEALQL